jgi:hypothetical protein
MHIFKTNIDLDKNEANNFRFQNEIAFPTLTGADTGFTFFHSGIGTFYGWDGTSWLDLGASGGGSYTLPTATDTILGGIKIDGTTVTIDGNGVISALNSDGFMDALDEGNGIGWRIVGRDPNLFGDIGLDAVDFSKSFSGYTTVGATGEGSLATGFINTASGAFSFVAGRENIAAGYSDALFGTYNTTNAGLTGYRFSAGIRNNLTGSFGGVALGNGLSNEATGAVVVGTSAEIVTGSGSFGFPDANTAMFSVGNGTFDYNALTLDVISRSNAFAVYYDGRITAPSTTIAIIDAESTGKQLVTKEWVSGKIPDYKVYRARLIQSGTSAPTADVFENTLSGTVVWTRTTTGDYSGTLAGEFPQDKTFVLITRAGSTGVLSAWQPDALVDDSVRIISQNFSGSAFDNWSGYIEILVYP